jgi:hypothetical protein
MIAYKVVPWEKILLLYVADIIYVSCSTEEMARVMIIVGGMI